VQVTTLLRLSVATAIVAIVLKTAAWWVTGSVGLLSDAMESFVNLASALFALAMVTIAARPADDDHPFGHTKAEYFSSAFEGLMIAAAAIAISWAAIGRFFHPQPLDAVGVGLALSIVSSVLNGLLAARMLAESRRHRSIALEADARHLYTDVWTSAGVVVGVVAVQLTGWLWLDPAVAIGVAINIIREGARVVWVSVDGLMDKALEPEVQERIDRTLARFAESSVRFDDMVTRRAGSRRFLEGKARLRGRRGLQKKSGSECGENGLWHAAATLALGNRQPGFGMSMCRDGRRWRATRGRPAFRPP